MVASLDKMRLMAVTSSPWTTQAALTTSVPCGTASR
jgi:hypothetical protein